MEVASLVTKEDVVSKQLSTSQGGPFKLNLLITLSSGINGQSVVLRMLGPITQLLSLRASEKSPASRYQLDYRRSERGATHQKWSIRGFRRHD